MSPNGTPASKSDRRKSKRKSCLEIIASAKIVRDPDTTDPLKVHFIATRVLKDKESVRLNVLG